MRSTLKITTPASTRTLLTIEEMQAVIGDSGTASDESLLAVEKRIAALITTECNIAIGSGAEPTLRQETVTETFRSVSSARLMLSRRHNIEIISIVGNDTALEADEFELIGPESGLVSRLRGDRISKWAEGKIVVIYKAGFADVPEDLRQVAIELFRMTWFAERRDPLVKAQTIDVEGIDSVRQDFWVGGLPGQGSISALPGHLADQLRRYRNVVLW